MYVPVFSMSGAVGMCMLVHEKYGHMGKFKLIECMKERMFSLYLRKICMMWQSHAKNVRRESIRECMLGFEWDVEGVNLVSTRNVDEDTQELGELETTPSREEDGTYSV